MRITVLGEVNHGKTSLVESLLNKKLLKQRAEYKDLRTRNLQIEDFKIKGSSHYLLDCPGHSSYLNNSILPIPYSDLIIILFSAVQGTIPEKILSILSYCKYHQLKILLVITKTDLCTRDTFIRRTTKILALLKVAGIENYDYCIFSTEKPVLRTALIEKIHEISLSINTSSDTFREILILRSFNLTKPGVSIKKYSKGIIGGLASTKTTSGKYYLNTVEKTIPVEITAVRSPGGDNGYITFETNLSGCFCSFNSLRGSIITSEPVLRDISVTLIIMKINSPLTSQKLKNCTLVNGFSSYIVSPIQVGLNKYKTTIPLLSGRRTFLLLYRVEKIWTMLAFGKILDK